MSRVVAMNYHESRALARTLARLPMWPANNPLQFAGTLHGITFVEHSRKARRYFAVLHLEVPETSWPRCPICHRRFVHVRAHILRRHPTVPVPGRASTP